jgi:hypothetical protein
VIQAFVRQNLRTGGLVSKWVLSNRHAEALRGYREDIRQALEIFRVRFFKAKTMLPYTSF